MHEKISPPVSSFSSLPLLLNMSELICEVVPVLRIIEAAIQTEDSVFLEWQKEHSVACGNFNRQKNSTNSSQNQCQNNNNNDNYGNNNNNNNNFFNNDPNNIFTHYPINTIYYPTQPIKHTPRPSEIVQWRIKNLQNVSRSASFPTSFTTSNSKLNSVSDGISTENINDSKIDYDNDSEVLQLDDIADFLD